MSTICRTIRVKNRLAKLLFKPGGISRTDAVVAATTEIESLRDDFVQSIPSEVDALEQLAAAGGPEGISASEIEHMLDRAARILTLSGTFGYPALDAVVKRFCDLCAGMVEKGMTSAAPIEVHLRAMRLVCPGSPPLGEAETAELLSEIARIHTHFGFAPCAFGDDDGAIGAG